MQEATTKKLWKRPQENTVKNRKGKEKRKDGK